MTYELHPLSTLFPRMQGADFEALCNDIQMNGLREPIVLHDGMILDGGNRYRACEQVGVKPTFKTFDGSSIVAFVLSVNLHRRHMTPGQQAAIVASAQDWAKAQAVGNPTFRQSGNATGLATVADRAAQSGASDKTQRMADKVAKASPDLAKKVAHGEVTLPKAVKQVEAKNPPKQRKAKPTTSVATETASPVTPDQKAPGPVTTTEGDDNPLGDFDPLEELKRMQVELDQAHALVKAAESNDLKAEAMKWRRAYDHAQREQSEAMDRAAREAKAHAFKHRQLMRCGKAVGEEDPDKVASAVEAFVRKAKGAQTTDREHA